MANTPNWGRAIGNEAATTLSAPISNSVLVFTGNDGSDFSASGGFIIMDEGISGKEEVMYVESKSGSTFTVATDGRGLADTSAVSHDAGATITDIIVTDMFNGPRTSFLTGHNDDGTHKSSLTFTSPTITGATLTTATITTPTLTLKQSTTPTPTAEGDIQWDTDDNSLAIGDGAATRKVDFGAYRTWVPTFTNLSGGTLTAARYCQQGTHVHVMIKYTMAGANVSGAVSFTLPVAAQTDWQLLPLGNVIFADAGVAEYPGVVRLNGTNDARIDAFNSAATYLVQTLSSSTVPFVFASADVLLISFAYEAA